MSFPKAMHALQALLSFLRARSRHERLNTPQKISEFQNRQIEKFLLGPARGVPANEHITSSNLKDWPIISKSDQNQNFSRYNRPGIMPEQILHALDSGSSRVGEYTVGVSTGTSGNRGHYVISEQERFRWLGVILSRSLPDFWRSRYRVAVVLPSNSRLYESANESQRLKLKFFPTSEGVEPQIQSILDFNPNVVVASPRLLRCLVEKKVPLRLKHLFSGAEVLSSFDRVLIEGYFNLAVREIYMATEGLFAVACHHGSMHLIEDHLLFEWEDVPNQPHLKKPIITDFSRSAQIMVRYRMNDLVELGGRECLCGSHFQIIKSVIGRDDDTFRLLRDDQSTIHVTPDVIRNTVVDANSTVSDFRVILVGENRIALHLPTRHAQCLTDIEGALLELFRRLNVTVTLDSTVLDGMDTGQKKLRRVYVDTGTF